MEEEEEERECFLEVENSHFKMLCSFVLLTLGSHQPDQTGPEPALMGFTSSNGNTYKLQMHLVHISQVLLLFSKKELSLITILSFHPQSCLFYWLKVQRRLVQAETPALVLVAFGSHRVVLRSRCECCRVCFEKEATVLRR